MERKKFISTRGWSNQSILKFFEGFDREEIVRATLKDPEMCCHLNSLCYLVRAHNENRLFFEKLPSDLMQVIIKMTYEEFLHNLSEKVKNDEVELFDWYFEDAVVKESGDIFSQSDAVLLMRDQLIGLMVSKIIKSVFVLGMKDSGLDHMNLAVNLFKYNSKKHSGSKFHCYKNHIMLDYAGLLIFGSSMLYQNQIELEEVEDFDSFCERFEPYLMGIMKEVEIDMSLPVSKSEFQNDMKSIMARLVSRNFIFCEVNYKPKPVEKFFKGMNIGFVESMKRVYEYED